MKRQRFDRAILVELECGCIHRGFTGRYRVSKDLAGCMVSDLVRKGVWCFKHPGTQQPTKFLGVGPLDPARK